MIWKIPSTAAMILLGTAWLAALAGLCCLSKYELEPGATPRPPSSIGQPGALYSKNQPFTLLVFLHPQCPCSRATLANLERIMAHCGKSLCVRVFFWQPAELTADWHNSFLEKAVRKMPSVQATSDIDGALTRHFAINSSGTAVLYDRTGKLLFTGGITDGRGHEGDNVGSDFIQGIVRGRLATGATRVAPVFGCSF